MKPDPKFLNRVHAGQLLAEHLAIYQGRPCTLVVGLPRGGVPVAAAVAAGLKLPLEVFVSRKIHPPETAERALGAVTETGLIHLDESVVEREPWIHRHLLRYIQDQIALEEKEVGRRVRCYRGACSLPPLKGQTIILVDDAIFSGETFLAAARSLRRLGAQRIVGAVPVAQAETVQRMRMEVDELLVLSVIPQLERLEQSYRECPEVTDQTVIEHIKKGSRHLLAAAAGRR